MIWKVKEDSTDYIVQDDKRLWYCDIVDENNKTVCEIWAESDEECLERAKLICDAPQMKERLIKLQSNEG